MLDERHLLLLVLMAIGLDGVKCYTKNVLVVDRKLFVNNVEYYIKGMVYQPVPLGVKSMQDDGHGGAGLCSPKMTPWNEFRSACYDSDYYDSSEDVDRIPSGPSSWFEGLWERDFPIMKEMGVNTLRLYSANPTNEIATISLLDERWNNIKSPLGKNHVGFMNLANSFGFKVIFPLVTDESALRLDSDSLIERKIKNIIDEVGNHPALLMWVTANEIDLTSAESMGLLQRVNRIMDLAREYTLEKWNRTIPVTYCTQDLPSIYEYLAENLRVDVFCTNSGYRGSNYNTFWNRDENYNFLGWTELSRRKNLPVLIGEIGFSTDNPQSWLEYNWFNIALKDMIDHVDHGCIGMVYFEYNDEKHKPGNEKSYGVVSFVPHIEGRYSSEETVDYFHPDDVVIKEDLFNSICCGRVGDEEINYNIDIFGYLNRPPMTIIGSDDDDDQTPDDESSDQSATITRPKSKDKRSSHSKNTRSQSKDKRSSHYSKNVKSQSKDKRSHYSKNVKSQSKNKRSSHYSKNVKSPQFDDDTAKNDNVKNDITENNDIAKNEKLMNEDNDQDQESSAISQRIPVKYILVITLLATLLQ